jgi:Putative beta-barrel porin-2, OmpL-like. bbp2
MKNTFSLLPILLFCFLPGAFLLAQAPPPPAETPAATPAAPEEPKLNVSGAVDAYYQYNFSKSPVSTSFTGAHNSFALGMAQLTFSKETGKVGFVADLSFGPRAEAGNYGFYGASVTDQLIKQLYVTYKPTDKLKFTLGNFGTFIGYEVIDAPLNFNYSTSYMFSYGPFYHTGLKAEYALTDNLTAMVGTFNDTDSKFDVNGPKHVGAQLAYVKGDFKGYLNYLGGKQGDDTTGFKVNQIDFVGIYQLGKLALALNLTNQMRSYSLRDENAAWMGGALYANYAITDGFLLGARAEYLSDKEHTILGEGGDGTNVTEFTLSANIKLPGGLTLIPEFRLDNASTALFQDKDGKPSKQTAGVLLAAVYKF